MILSQRKILFILPTVKEFTGGEKVNMRLLETARKICPETELIELDLLENSARKWLKNLFAIRYLGRVFKMIYFMVSCPRTYKSLTFSDFYSAKDLFLYLLINRVFLRTINLSYFHQISSDLNIIRLPGKIKTLNNMINLLVFDLVIVNSRFNEKVVMSLRVPTKKIKVLYPLLIDEPPHNPKDNKKNDDMIHLLFIGGSFKRKGILYAIQAIKLLNRKDLQFDIVGSIDKDREYADYLIRTVKDNGLSKQIRFRDRVDNKTLNSLLRTSDIFLFPTLFEGFGIAIAEAMSYQLPVISTNISAIPELVQDGENGILVPPENPSAIAAAITKLSEDSSLRMRMGKDGYQKIKRFYESYRPDIEFQNIIGELIRK